MFSPSSHPNRSRRLIGLLPGLIWPGTLPAALPPLPALAWLLARGACSRAPAQSASAWLEARCSAQLAWGPLRRAGEALPAAAPAASCLCADPASVRFAGRELVLQGARTLRLSAAEAQALVADLNREFATLGEFEYASPERFYLHTRAAVAASFTPLAEAIGRPAGHFPPQGPDASHWQQIANAVQIFLHQHPVSRTREAQGLATPNTLWFWGAGIEADFPPPAACIVSTDAALLGLARRSNAQTAPSLEAALTAHGGDILWHDDTLGAAAREGDFLAWRDALLTLEAQFFAPLCAHLCERRLHAIELHAPGDRHSLVLHAAGRARFAFWRRPLAAPALAALLQDRPA